MTTEKLVRDLIPEVIRRRGGEPVYRYADAAESTYHLCQKLIEEAEEVSALYNRAYVARERHGFPSGEAFLDELADVLEVLKTLCARGDLQLEDLERRRGAKAEQLGGFRLNVILEAQNPRG